MLGSNDERARLVRQIKANEVIHDLPGEGWSPLEWNQTGEYFITRNGSFQLMWSGMEWQARLHGLHSSPVGMGYTPRDALIGLDLLLQELVGNLTNCRYSIRCLLGYEGNTP